MRVPMDNMSTSSFKSNIEDIIAIKVKEKNFEIMICSNYFERKLKKNFWLPAAMPVVMLATYGVFSFGRTLPRLLKITPSVAIAYTIRGIGNIPAYKLMFRKKCSAR